MEKEPTSIEVEAESIPKAIAKALQHLKVKNKKEVQITILREEQKGLFGMPGAKLAKVRVSKKHKAGDNFS